MIIALPLQPWRTVRTRSVSIREISVARERIQAVVDTAKERNIPIRVGVNSGSLEKELVEKYQRCDSGRTRGERT